MSASKADKQVSLEEAQIAKAFAHRRPSYALVRNYWDQKERDLARLLCADDIRSSSRMRLQEVTPFIWNYLDDQTVMYLIPSVLSFIERHDLNEDELTVELFFDRIINSNIFEELNCDELACIANMMKSIIDRISLKSKDRVENRDFKMRYTLELISDLKIDL